MLWIECSAHSTSPTFPMHEIRNFVVDDTLVNYCKLVRSGYEYGKLMTDKKNSITSKDVDEFNNLWKDVFNISKYQAGISLSEFTSSARFKEGNQDAFPPSNLYHKDNPDTYILFHIAKEIGAIKSQAYTNCPQCVQTSLDKVNELLKTSSLQSQFSKIWLGTGSPTKLTTVKQLTDFWDFLKCMSIDDRVNPKNQPMFINLKPYIKCPDTTFIKCKDEIKLKVSVGWRHCEVGGKIDTIGPKLVKGKDNCPDAVYSVKYVAKDFCHKSDSCTQFFVIKNDKPSFTCPSDTLVECIEKLNIHKLKVTASCDIKTKQTTRGPTLVSGKHNCPYAVYKLEYMVKDSCGQEVTCIQKITIQNDGPTISCPLDVTVECKKDIKHGKYKYTVSCKLGYDVTVTGPFLMKGKDDCPGAVYELDYEIKDSCDRTAKCIQKFIIKNDGPTIKCPPNKEVLCFDDISTTVPPDFKVACGLGYDIKITDPKLIIGIMNCVGSVYSVTYTITDACGRSASCEQLFTILNPDLLIKCPPDRTVLCAKDIKEEKPVVTIACKLNYTITAGPPVHVSGKEDCPGAKYTITYIVKDACGRVKECIQTFTIKNPDPEYVCPQSDTEVQCYEEIKVKEPMSVVSCGLKYQMIATGPKLVSGMEKCDGARYVIHYVLTDECGRKAECDQFFVLRIPPTTIACPQTRTVECEGDIKAEMPLVVTYCDITYTLTTDPPVLDKGKRNCPGAIYLLKYHVVDECKREVTCEQTFIISNRAPTITCPPDHTVSCKFDITTEDVQISESCDTSAFNISNPLLVSGNAECAGAVYEVTYSLKDLCGRSAQCKQRITVVGKAPEILCPRDTVVRLKTDIKAGKLLVTEGCTSDYKISTIGPELISGIDGMAGAVYAITYTLEDKCHHKKTCVQKFTLIDIPDDGIFTICDCMKQYGQVSIDLIEDPDQRFHKDLAALIKKYGCDKLKAWIQSGVVELWTAWSTSEILGNNTGLANDIARRGDINIVMKNLDKINKSIEILESAINGEPDESFKKMVEWGITEGANAMVGSGTPALLYSSIKSLGDFAQYMNSEILKINIRTLANYADTDPQIFDPDHYLREYAKIREIKPGDRVEWNDIHNKFRIAIYEYAQHRMNNVKLPPLNEMWSSQQNMTLLRTVTYTMLQEVCQFWCYKLRIKQHMNQLIHEQTLLLRFKAVIDYLKDYDCDGNEKPCTMPNAEMKEINGKFVCECINGYKWDPSKNRCLPYTDCSTIANTVEVYNSDSYSCDCIQGFEWNTDHTACIAAKPNCESYYSNSEALWDPASNAYLCYCKQGYEWNSNRTACVVTKPDCPTIYANTEAVWNAASNAYVCDCKQGFEWNIARTACVASKPDCNSFYANSEAVWDNATNQYLCNCKQGFEWNSGRTACIVIKPDCNAYYANSEAVWDNATNQYLCNCKIGFEWNSTRTACISAKPDCNSFYANSEAVWDNATNQYLCNCKQGFEWNSTRTACIDGKPDCNAYYANSEAVWDNATNQYLCNCKQGFEWNSTRTACVSKIPDCNSFYRNSVAVWDAATNQYLCNCPQGYVWNSTRTECITSQVPDCSAYYKNSVALWDPSTSQYLCYCNQGFEWNLGRTECVPLGNGNRDNPQVNPAQQKNGDCNIEYKSGANEPEQYTIDVRRTTGSLNFTYQTYDVKDRIHIYHGGSKVFDTGCVGASGSQVLTLNGASSVFVIIVDPLCAPGESNTSWNFTLGCPN